MKCVHTFTQSTRRVNKQVNRETSRHHSATQSARWTKEREKTEMDHKIIISLCGLTFFVCRARGILEHLDTRQRLVSILTAISRRRATQTPFHFFYSFNLVKIHELLCQIELIDDDIIHEGNWWCAVCVCSAALMMKVCQHGFVRSQNERAPFTRHTNEWTCLRRISTVFGINWMECSTSRYVDVRCPRNSNSFWLFGGDMSDKWNGFWVMHVQCDARE